MPKTDGGSTRSSQNYLRALLLCAGSGGPVSTNEVARYFGVAPASVTGMLQKLAAEGYVDHSPYRGTTLTAKGVREAQRITRKHRLLERFLSDVLHIPLERVHAQACEMEHTLSDEAEESLCRLLNHPDRCSDDGQLIPACDLPFDDCEHCLEARSGVESVRPKKRSRSLSSITSLKPGEVGRISFIRGDGVQLQELRSKGLTAGAVVKLGPKPSRGQPLEAVVGGRDVAIGEDVSAKVFVTARTGAKGRRPG